MNTRFVLAGALVVISVTGCASVETGDHVWFKEGATAREKEAALAAAQVNAVQADTTPALEKDIVIRSMTAQGWRLVTKNSAPSLKPNPNRKTPLP